MSDVETKDTNKIGRRNSETSDSKMSKESEDDFKDSDGSDRSFCLTWGEECSENITSDEDENSLYDSEDEWLEQARADRIFWHFYSQKLMGKKYSIYEQMASSALYERQKFIKKVMKAFAFGPIFDTFCFSLPRPKEWENGYKQSVKNVQNLLHQCKNGLLESNIVNFPTDSSKHMAEKLIQKLNRKLDKDPGNSSQLCDKGQKIIPVVGGDAKGDKMTVDAKQNQKQKDDAFNKSGKTKAIKTADNFDDEVTVGTLGKRKGKRRRAKRGNTSAPLNKVDKGKAPNTGDLFDSKASDDSQGQRRGKRRGAKNGGQLIDKVQDNTLNKIDKCNKTDENKKRGKTRGAKKRDQLTDKVQDDTLNKVDKCEATNTRNQSNCKGTDNAQGKRRGKKRGAEMGDHEEDEVKKKKHVTKTKNHPTKKLGKAEDRVSDEDKNNNNEETDGNGNCSDDDDMEYDDEYNDKTEEEVIDRILGNTFPHSLIHMLSDGKTNMFSSWCGQIQCRVNPVSKTLSILLFDYVPTYPEEIQSEILDGKLTRTVVKAVSQQIEKLECCRLFRMDIQLTDLKQLFVVHQNNNEMICYCRLIPPAKFYQRFINTSAGDRNKWKERQPFLPFEGKCFTECSQEYMFVLGGPVLEISDIVAQIMKCNPKQRIDLNPNKMSMSKLEKKIQEVEGMKDYSLRHTDIEKKFVVKVDFKQREKILNILKKYGLISKQVHDEMKGKVKVVEVRGQVKTYNCLDDLDLDPCFKDYINFECNDPEELEKHLKSTLQADAYGHNMEDLGLKYPEKYNFTELTVGEFLKAEKNPCGYPEIYYSFCRSAPETETCTYHCKICKECMDWRNWHCRVCGKCAYGVSNPRCEYCGFKKDKNNIVIQPSTYYSEKLWSSQVPNVVKKEWNVQLSTTDIPIWAQQMDVNKGTKKVFVLKDYLNHDNLGFLNLWNLAFCISSNGPRKYINRYFSERFRWHTGSDVSSFMY